MDCVANGCRAEGWCRLFLQGFPAFQSQGRAFQQFSVLPAAALVDYLLCSLAWGRAEGRALSTWSATSRVQGLGKSPLLLKKSEVA